MIETVLTWLAMGASSWWLLEYVLHRFVGHGKNARVEFAREHRRHHAVGDYFAPTSKKILYTTPVLAGVGAALAFAIDVPRGVSFTIGLTAMYAAYEIFHRRLHTHPPRGRFGRWARRHHFFHHFEDPSQNHGVTTPLFDILFRTQSEPGVIAVPRKLAMVWLVDPDTGDVRDDYRRDYRMQS